MDLAIKVWNLNTSQCFINLEGHFSAVTSFVIDTHGGTNTLIR